MTNTVLIKRSGTANSIPASGNLIAGELAINYNDGNLFYKDNAGNVQVIASNQFVSVIGNITGGNALIGGTISAFGNITGGNFITSGKLSSGNVIYTNVDGIADQVLTTYGNGVTYFKTVTSGSGGFVRVYMRGGGYVNVPVTFGYFTVVGRSGNINIPIAA